MAGTIAETGGKINYKSWIQRIPDTVDAWNLARFPTWDGAETL